MQTPAPTPIKIWLDACRPRTLPAAAAPVLAASALAWHHGLFQPQAAAICLIFALLVQIGANFANDYFDGIRGNDTNRSLGPARAVAAGWVSPVTMLTATLSVLAMALLVGLALVPFGGWWLLPVGITCVILALAYTGGPYPLAYHGLGDVFVVLCFGLAATSLTYYVQAGDISSASLWIGLGLGCLTNNILVVNNHRDRDEDLRAGKKTLIVRFGRPFGELQYLTALIIGGLCTFVLVYFHGYSPAVLIACIPLLRGFLMWLILRRAHNRSDYARLLGGSGIVVLMYALGLACGLMLPGYTGSPR